MHVHEFVPLQYGISLRFIEMEIVICNFVYNLLTKLDVYPDVNAWLKCAPVARSS